MYVKLYLESKSFVLNCVSVFTSGLSLSLTDRRLAVAVAEGTSSGSGFLSSY